MDVYLRVYIQKLSKEERREVMQQVKEELKHFDRMQKFGYTWDDEKPEKKTDSRGTADVEVCAHVRVHSLML